ncbi:MAG: hypothetical protein V4572_10790 [Bacteroidota bacterium]
MKTILVDAWNTFITEDGVNLELKSILDSFPNKKIILTNATSEECQKFGIINMPYEVFSLQHNPNKTDSAYFQKMLAHFDLNSNEVIYFEHNIEAVESAISAGITTFHYNNLIGLDKLTDFLNLNL